MGNMYKCVLASGTGNGIPLIVTCASAFAGLTITCTDGTTTLTDTCPSSSPYEITFNLPNTGTWTVSGVISGQTYYAYKTISDVEVELVNIPDGATVTPTNDVQILLNCANIWDKSYTTISQLLADTTSLLAVISDNNAADYLVRSTTWASSIVANSTAMTYIGANSYCANILIDNATWLTAICNSTYFNSVLNAKVPTMTSNTTPSGLASASSIVSGYDAYKAFDGSTTNGRWQSNDNTNAWVEYDFTSATKVKYATIKPFVDGNSLSRIKNFKIQVYTTSWIDVYSDTMPNSSALGTFIFNNTKMQKKWRLLILDHYSSRSSDTCGIFELQLYGRQDA